MIEDAGNGQFSAIIVHKLDRFSRDRYDSAIYRRKLKRAEVSLISVLERLDDSPESVIMASMLEGMAEYYSRNLAREVKKGLTENALKARHNGGVPPLGYRHRKDALKEELDEMESKSSNLDLATREKLIEYLLHQSTALDKGGAAQQKVILRFIEKVVINDEDVTIYYRIDDPSFPAPGPGIVCINGRGDWI
jgi:DNA invertase Pin-like site-specific DNA recombinase